MKNAVFPPCAERLCSACNRHTRASCGWCFHWGCVRGTRDIGVQGQRGDTCDRSDARDVLLSRSLGAMKHTLRAEEKRVQAWLVRMHLALHMRAILRIGVRAMPTQADEGDCWRCAARRCAQ